MKNNKLTEFILKYEKFYKCLSDYNKHLISDLDTYENLQLYYSIGNNFYLYVGRKLNKHYFCKFISTRFHMYDISNSVIIITENTNDFIQCFVTNKIDNYELDYMV